MVCGHDAGGVGAGRSGGHGESAAVDRPDGPACAVAGGPGQVGDTTPVLLALGRALGRPELALRLPYGRAAAPVVRVDDSLLPPLFSEAATLAGPDRTEGLDPLPTDFRIAPAAMVRALDDSGEADLHAPVSPPRNPNSGAKPDHMAWLAVGLALGWLFLTVLLGLGQAWRIIRFRGRLRAAVPAPEYLVEEAERIGRCLSVRVPKLLVVPDLRTPLALVPRPAQAALARASGQGP